MRNGFQHTDRFAIFKNPADPMGPYGGPLDLPDGRRYRIRMRSHSAGDGHGFWYEGFVTAEDAGDYARDQQLARYPARPGTTKTADNLWPCQIKLNPFPSDRKRSRSPAVIGTVWVSRRDGAAGGEVFTLLGWQSRGQPVFVGKALPAQ